MKNVFRNLLFFCLAVCLALPLTACGSQPAYPTPTWEPSEEYNTLVSAFEKAGYTVSSVLASKNKEYKQQIIDRMGKGTDTSQFAYVTMTNGVDYLCFVRYPSEDALLYSYTSFGLYSRYISMVVCGRILKECIVVDASAAAQELMDSINPEKDTRVFHDPDDASVYLRWRLIKEGYSVSEVSGEEDAESIRKTYGDDVNPAEFVTYRCTTDDVGIEFQKFPSEKLMTDYFKSIGIYEDLYNGGWLLGNCALVNGTSESLALFDTILNDYRAMVSN